MEKKTAGSFLIVLALLMPANAAVLIDELLWEMIQVTDNSRHDVHPRTDGERVTWTGYRFDGGYDICLYDIAAQTTEYIGISSWSPLPKVLANWVTWRNHGSIEVYDIASKQTNSIVVSNKAAYVGTNGDTIWYTDEDGTGHELFAYNAVTHNITQATQADMLDYHCAFRGTDIAYTSGFQQREGQLYYHNVQTQQTITISNATIAGGPVFAGNYLVYDNTDPQFGNREIVATDLDTFANVSLCEGYSPVVLNDMVYWGGSDGTGYELFSFDPTTTIVTQITNEDYEGLYVQSAGGTVTWSDTVAGGVQDIHFFDGDSIDVLTEVYSGKTYGYTSVCALAIGSGSNNIEIVLYNPVPEPATLSLLGLGGIFLRTRRKA